MRTHFHVLVLLQLVGVCKSFLIPRASRVVLSRGNPTVLVESLDEDSDSFGKRKPRRRCWWFPFRHIRSKRTRRREMKRSNPAVPPRTKLATTLSAILKMPKRPKIPKRFAQVLCIAITLIALSPILPGDFAPVHQATVQSRPSPIVRVLDRTTASSQFLARNVAAVTPFEGSHLSAKMSFGRADTPPRTVDAMETAVLNKEDVQKQVRESSNDDGVPKVNNPTLSGADRRHDVLSFVTEAVEKVGPSVLRIDTETTLYMGESAVGPSADYIQQGQGSGVIFSKEGFVVTNAHVVEDASKVTVTLTDGRVFEAVVCGADEIVDIGMSSIMSFTMPLICCLSFVQLCSRFFQITNERLRHRFQSPNSEIATC